MREQLKPAVIMLAAFTLLTGILYPLVMTGFAQLVFPRQANGSLISRDNVVVGSALIGQRFSGPEWFWSRLSATGPQPYNAASSSGSNYGPTSEDLAKAVAARVNELHAADPTVTGPVPVDLVTASSSGLDPDISPAAALYQAHRVAMARSLSVDSVNALVHRHVQGRTFGFLGEPRVNVLRLNLALDSLARAGGARGGPSQ